MRQVSRETIAHALADLTLSSAALDKLTLHWELVLEWNRRTNLTAIEDPVEAAWLHYRDSLEVMSILLRGSITDIGSGAGFPGIPIAIADPSRPTTLVEPRRKRASFLEVATTRLALSNVQVLTRRVEEQPIPTSTVVTRATFSDERELFQCMAWVKPGGCLIAFRAQSMGNPDRVHTYTLRGDPRCLLLWRR